MNSIPCDRAIGQWDRYFKLTCQRDSSALAVETMSYALLRRNVLDLGAGAMNDSIYYLEQGVESVVAVDASPDSITYADNVAQRFPGRFDFRNARFSEVEYTPESFDVVHSNFALPFHGKVGFEKLIAAVVESVRVNGLLSIILFGNEDGWKDSKPDVPFHSKDEVTDFLRGFEVIVFKEIRTDGHTQDRSPKFWHIFKIIARRIQPVL